MVKEALEKAAIANPDSPVAREIQDSQFASLQLLMTGVVTEITVESIAERNRTTEAERGNAGRALVATLQEVITGKGEDLLVEAREKPHSTIGQELQRLENPVTPQDQKFINLGKAALASFGRNKGFSKTVERDWKALVGKLIDSSQDDMGRFLQMFAEGLDVSESGINVFFREIAEEQKKISASKADRDPAFTIPTQTFVIIVAMLSGLTSRAGREYLDFLNNRAGLKGNITIDQIYLPVANWLSENQGQNPK